MFLISYGKAELRYKIQTKDLENLPVQWYQYRPIYKRKQSLAETEFVYAVQKFWPETKFFVIFFVKWVIIHYYVRRL